MTTTLEHIAQEFALRKNEGEQNKLRYLMYAKAGLRQLKLTIEQNIKSVMIDLDELNSLVLPDDFMKVYKLGYCVNGRILELDRDDSIYVCPPSENVNYCTDDDQEEEVSDECRITNDCELLCAGQDLPWYGSVGSWDNIYYHGVRSSYPSYPAYVSKGFYTIKNNRIYVNGCCSGGQLVLEYDSTGKSIGEISLIPEELTDYILADIRYNIELDKPQSTKLAAAKDERRIQYNIYKNYKIRIYLKDAVKSRRKTISQANIGR